PGDTSKAKRETVVTEGRGGRGVRRVHRSCRGVGAGDIERNSSAVSRPWQARVSTPGTVAA
ncbi:hypothetical protein, partial [Streptomyces sp. NPDC005568]|uniref:hypothetical protein n=1 Tax=Streptomyces sp. NPDC005568 TaxID=3156887 RepID=UPI0033B09869